MKYIISESKLESLIYKQIDKINEFKDLEQFDCSHFDWDISAHVEAYCFKREPNEDPIIEYFPKPSSIPEDKINDVDYQMYYESLPSLVLDSSIQSYFNNIFGNSWEEVFKRWFEENYKLKVENIF